MGTYDAKTHNAITSVTVNPSDAKIEYSTDGTNYSTTMPTISEVSSFQVNIRASKSGYISKVINVTVQQYYRIMIVNAAVVGNYTLRVRSSPNLEAYSIGSLESGQKIQVVDNKITNSDGEWYEIVGYGSGKAYVMYRQNDIYYLEDYVGN